MGWESQSVDMETMGGAQAMDALILSLLLTVDVPRRFKLFP